MPHWIYGCREQLSLKGDLYMRRMILTSLVLFPVLAHAQAGTVTEPKPSTSSAMLQAELKQPAGLAEVAFAASAASSSVAAHAVIKQSIQTQYNGDFVEAALRQGGTLEYSMAGSEPMEVAPKITRAVELDLTPQELSEQPAVSTVVVKAIVDEYGIPRNVKIAQSAGPVVDQKAIAAVSQYRFKPATVNNQATWAAVSVSIKIQK
jgi:TonB family protein